MRNLKNFTKILSVVLAIILTLSLASCSFSKQYSYKTDDVELPIGVYIFSLYTAYSQAEGYAQKSDLYDSEKKTYDGDKSFLKIEITDDDGKKATADEWIYEEADKQMKNILATYKVFNELGCTIDEATAENYEKQCKEYWDNGPYASYGAQYKNPYSEIFEPLGVSYDSFYLASFYSAAMQEAIFKAMYDEGGTKAVSNKDLTKFFTDNYTSYTYFSANLFTEATEDEASAEDTLSNTEEAAASVPLSDTEIQKYKDSFAGYVDDIKNGAKAEEVVSEYMKDFEVAEDTSVTQVENLDNASIGEDIKTEILNLKEGTASYKIIGDDDTSKVIYFFYKEPIDNQIENYIEDDTNKTSLLQELKGDEFKDYIDDLAETIEPTISSVCKNYNLKKFESKEKESKNSAS